MPCRGTRIERHSRQPNGSILILAPLSGRNAWNTLPGVKTRAEKDRSLSVIAFDASRSTTVRFCDVGSSRSTAHEDPTSRSSILHQASKGLCRTGCAPSRRGREPEIGMMPRRMRASLTLEDQTRMDFHLLSMSSGVFQLANNGISSSRTGYSPMSRSLRSR
jgi:hypothetical protein